MESPNSVIAFLTSIQVLILISYFLLIYAYKALLEILEDNKKSTLITVMRGMIPAINLISAVALGYFGIADFNITAAVIGMMATGGTADLISIPKKIAKNVKG